MRGTKEGLCRVRGRPEQGAGAARPPANSAEEAAAGPSGKVAAGSAGGQIAMAVTVNVGDERRAVAGLACLVAERMVSGHRYSGRDMADGDISGNASMRTALQ
jgi:hypothetical protein